DNDSDGFVDCQDDECSAEAACTDPCSAAQLLTIPDYASGNNIAGGPSVLAPSCTATTGPELVFQVTAQLTDNLTVSFSPWGGFDGSVSIRTVCNDPATEIACVNNNGSGQTENVSIPAVQGTTYYIIAEGTSPSANGFWDLQVDQPLPESSCDFQFDDDFDGYLDCDDPSNCKGQSFECSPGPGTLGTSCFQNNQCAANDGDPICLNWNQGFNNGYCSEFCATSADCTNGTCVDINISVHGVCFKNCASFNDCPAGTSCVDIGVGQTVCSIPPEISCQDWGDDDADNLIDCEDPSACKGISPNCTSGPVPPGGPCQIHNQCTASDGDPYCEKFWPGGYCTEFCDLGLNDCAAGSVCTNYLFFPSGNGTCMDECVNQSDCRPGYFCQPWNNTSICVP
ncbi:MAG: hypothetical protein JNL21_18190, partial [Myxococcales bacterium]|nr:hypothetical protein [Myxococcales bacterium]